MADEYTEVTQQGWGNRLGKSFMGIIIGLILSLVSLVGLFWNEGRAVKRHQTLDEGGGIVVSTEAERVDPALNEKLVHLTGTAVVEGELSDDQFGVAAPAIRLDRRVEMYQWNEKERTETKNKVGGGTEKVKKITYEKQWSASLKNSDRFKNSGGHENPKAMRFQSKNWTASVVTLGVYRLPEFFISQIKGESALTISSIESLPEALRSDAKLHEGGLYFGENPSAPAIGDLRVQFSAVTPTEISVVGEQVGDTFEKYKTAAGGELEILAMGTHSAEAMFEAEEAANKTLTWIFRGGGFLLMSIGMTLVAQPLKVLADVIPFAGRIVGGGIAFFAFAIAAIVSSVTIASAWIFYRPIIGISVLVITVLVGVLLFKRLRNAKPPEMNLSMPADNTPPPLE